MGKWTVDLKKIAGESRETLLNPKEYFASIPLSGGFEEPVIKALVYGTVAGLFGLLWDLTGFNMVGVGAWGTTGGISALIWSLVTAVIGLFIGGAIVWLISHVCGGNREYEASVRVASSIMVVYPINAFLSCLYAISLTLGGLSALFVNLFSIYIMYMAVQVALKGRESSLRIVVIVMGILAVMTFFGGQKAGRSVEEISDIFQEQKFDE
jgi:hypothetical protein